MRAWWRPIDPTPITAVRALAVSPIDASRSRWQASYAGIGVEDPSRQADRLRGGALWRSAPRSTVNARGQRSPILESVMNEIHPTAIIGDQVRMGEDNIIGLWLSRPPRVKTRSTRSARSG